MSGSIPDGFCSLDKYIRILFILVFVALILERNGSSLAVCVVINTLLETGISLVSIHFISLRTVQSLRNFAVRVPLGVVSKTIRRFYVKKTLVRQEVIKQIGVWQGFRGR